MSITKNIGDTVTISASASNGPANVSYTIRFTVTNGSGTVNPPVISGLNAGQTGTSTYTVQPSDAGKTLTFSAVAEYTCPSDNTTKTSTTVSNTVTVNQPCNTPVCNFSIR